MDKKKEQELRRQLIPDEGELKSNKTKQSTLNDMDKNDKSEDDVNISEGDKIGLGRIKVEVTGIAKIEASQTIYQLECNNGQYRAFYYSGEQKTDVYKHTSEGFNKFHTMTGKIKNKSTGY